MVIVQTAPAVRAALGEEFGFPPGTVVTGKMVYALRELGFDYVFDTDFAADLTIMEEGSEILNRLTCYLNGDKSVRLPILTSCCPAWVNFFEHHFPDLLDIHLRPVPRSRCSVLSPNHTGQRKWESPKKSW